MGKKVDEKTKAEEAANLLSRIRDSWKSSDAAFAAAAKRTRAELKQHLTGARPIPLSAVKSYAEVLNCTIREISPRWASELDWKDGVKRGLMQIIEAGIPDSLLFHPDAAPAGEQTTDQLIAELAERLAAEHPDDAEVSLAVLKGAVSKARRAKTPTTPVADTLLSFDPATLTQSADVFKPTEKK